MIGGRISRTMRGFKANLDTSQVEDETTTVFRWLRSIAKLGRNEASKAERKWLNPEVAASSATAKQ